MEETDEVVEKIKKFGGENVKFIILYGSQSTNNQTPMSDADIAVYYDAGKEQRFKFRMKILGRVDDHYDIQIFQDLPLYIKKDVIKGNLLYTSDKRLIHDISRKTYREFDDFKKRFYDYIKKGVIT
ncbi:MAG TPA: nucleotidyltransferase domain-containing protein [Candidatus Thermoplasmatota archaeon]|nr:nucleotidyltransferase domain-containing protein [Candidatus Thermoplasmatota archaeon]